MALESGPNLAQTAEIRTSVPMAKAEQANPFVKVDIRKPLDHLRGIIKEGRPLASFWAMMAKLDGEHTQPKPRAEKPPMRAVGSDEPRLKDVKAPKTEEQPAQVEQVDPKHKQALHEFAQPYIQASGEKGYLRLVENDLGSFELSEREGIDRSKIKDTLAIPVYKEMNNGKFQQLLECFMKQDGGVDDKAIILAINNTPDNETAKAENSQLYNVVRFINGQTPKLPEGLTPEMRVVAREARERKLNLVALDMSSKGYIKDMARIRTIATTYAAYYAQGDPHGFIGWLDADTRLSAEYFKSLEGWKNDGADVVFQSLDYFMDKDPRVAESGFDYQFMMHRNYLVNILSPSQEKTFGGPLIVSEKELFMQALSGFKETNELRVSGQAEDFAMSQILAKKARECRFNPTKTITTADRVRSDGFDALIRLETMGDKREGYQTLNETILLHRLAFTENDGRVWRYDDLQTMFDNAAIPLDRELMAQSLEEIGLSDSVDTIRRGEGSLNIDDVRSRIGRYLELKNYKRATPREWESHTEHLLKARLSEEERVIVEQHLMNAEMQWTMNRANWQQMLQDGYQTRRFPEEWTYLAEEVSKHESPDAFRNAMEARFPAYFSTDENHIAVQTGKAAWRTKELVRAVYQLMNQKPESRPGLQALQQDLS